MAPPTTTTDKDRKDWRDPTTGIPLDAKAITLRVKHQAELSARRAYAARSVLDRSTTTGGPSAEPGDEPNGRPTGLLVVRLRRTSPNKKKRSETVSSSPAQESADADAEGDPIEVESIPGLPQPPYDRTNQSSDGSAPVTPLAITPTTATTVPDQISRLRNSKRTRSSEYSPGSRGSPVAKATRTRHSISSLGSSDLRPLSFPLMFPGASTSYASAPIPSGFGANTVLDRSTTDRTGPTSPGLQASMEAPPILRLVPTTATPSSTALAPSSSTYAFFTPNSSELGSMTPHLDRWSPLPSSPASTAYMALKQQPGQPTSLFDPRSSASHATFPSLYSSSQFETASIEELAYMAAHGLNSFRSSLSAFHDGSSVPPSIQPVHPMLQPAQFPQLPQAAPPMPLVPPQPTLSDLGCSPLSYPSMPLTNYTGSATALDSLVNAALGSPGSFTTELVDASPSDQPSVRSSP